MTEIERILDQLKRAFEGEAWHGPSVLETLNGVDAEMAAATPLEGTHSIWDLALHILAWEKAVLRRLLGDGAQIYRTDEDWPVGKAQDDAAWEEVKQRLIENHRELLVQIAALDDAKLEMPILEGMSSVYITIHGVIQHDIYHAGQIGLLKRALSQSQQLSI